MYRKRRAGRRGRGTEAGECGACIPSTWPWAGRSARLDCASPCAQLHRCKLHLSPASPRPARIITRPGRYPLLPVEAGISDASPVSIIRFPVRRHATPTYDSSPRILHHGFFTVDFFFQWLGITGILEWCRRWVGSVTRCHLSITGVRYHPRKHTIPGMDS